jgi:hypothetical protein
LPDTSASAPRPASPATAGDGNGVDAAGNVVIKVPSRSDVQKVTYTTAPAPPGSPGGSASSGGSGGKNNMGGTGGGTGNPGATGAQGQPGTVSGKPAQITVMPR